MKVAEAFNKNMFWDVNPEKLEWKKNSPFIIEKILARGGMTEVKTIMKFYTKGQVVEAVKKIQVSRCGNS